MEGNVIYLMVIVIY